MDLESRLAQATEELSCGAPDGTKRGMKDWIPNVTQRDVGNRMRRLDSKKMLPAGLFDAKRLVEFPLVSK
ncbi:hypothetical protein C8Q80DRAFT_1165744 [Daedaleopsis nitida]|nr:hypothetical protein C8Q80DRAFT_1165744 [Daedaleopsis nitida]